MHPLFVVDQRGVVENRLDVVTYLNSEAFVYQTLTIEFLEDPVLLFLYH